MIAPMIPKDIPSRIRMFLLFFKNLFSKIFLEVKTYLKIFSKRSFINLFLVLKIMLQHLKFIFDFLYKIRYLHFFIIGATGVLLELFFSWFFAEFVFVNGMLIFNIFFRNTTLGIAMGKTAGLIYTFFFHTKITFQTKKGHSFRFVIFVIYSLFITYLVALPLTLVLRNFLEFVFPLIHLGFLSGFEYLISSAFVILFFSFFNFIVFKFWLFRNK